jgi:hypothetical protein
MTTHIPPQLYYQQKDKTRMWRSLRAGKSRARFTVI